MRRETGFVSIATLLFLLSAASNAEARTWYVNEAGTGDAPTIQAAMDSAAYGDTVLVAAGTYLGSVDMTSGVALVSESGAQATVLTELSRAIVRFGPGVSGSLEGFLLTGVINPYFDVPAVMCWQSGYFQILNNIITGNLCAGIECTESWAGGEIAKNTIVNNAGCGIYIGISGSFLVRNNICLGNGCGISLGDSWIEARCNDCWDNEYPGWTPPAALGNFSADPFFCDREGGDFSLDACSPCLPGQDPNGYGCSLVGALGQGCDSPSASPNRSWGGIKAMFR